MNVKTDKNGKKMKTLFPSLLSLAVMLAMTFGLSAKTLEMSFKTVPKTLATAEAVNVVYVPGNTSGTLVTITGPDDKVGNVKVKMKGTTLSIGMTIEAAGHRNNGDLVRGVKITVHTGLVTSFSASSASEISCTSRLDYGNGAVNIDASSAADVEFGFVKCGSLGVGTSSACDVEIDRVEAANVSLEASSAAEIEIDFIKADRLEASASSCADISVKGGAVGTLKAKANSGADIDLHGMTARTQSISKNSGGSVKIGTK